jgi:hypothetical protein
MWGCGRVHSWIGAERSGWATDLPSLAAPLGGRLPLLVNAPVRSGVGVNAGGAQLGCQALCPLSLSFGAFALGFSACVLCLPPLSLGLGALLAGRDDHAVAVAPAQPGVLAALDTPRATASRPGRCRRTMSHPCAPAGHARARKRATARPPSAALGHTRCSAQPSSARRCLACRPVLPPRPRCWRRSQPPPPALFPDEIRPTRLLPQVSRRGHVQAEEHVGDDRRLMEGVEHADIAIGDETTAEARVRP